MPKSPESPFLTAEDLREVREHTDWRTLFAALGLTRDPKRSREHDWWALSPLTQEKTPSFHINDQGWYCHSTGQGGGAIELVQQVIGTRTGQALTCYEAGRWLLENRLSFLSTLPASSPPPSPAVSSAPSTTPAVPPRGEKKEKGQNRPIHKTLVPSLEVEHPELARRGISVETCHYLGCGYLPELRADGTPRRSSLKNRIVFQVRGLQEDAEGTLKPVILTHLGRALTPEAIEEEKWKPYGGFHKTLELYNLDKVILDARAAEQIRQTGQVLVVEGCFDVAKLVEAEIYNAVATFGWSLSEEQCKRLDLIAEHTGARRFLFWYDRDRAGQAGHEKARELLKENERFETATFDWEMAFPSPTRGEVKIPPAITDVCEFSVEQLRWLRREGVI